MLCLPTKQEYKSHPASSGVFTSIVLHYNEVGWEKGTLPDYLDAIMSIAHTIAFRQQIYFSLAASEA
jgi:hypothetical protein